MANKQNLRVPTSSEARIIGAKGGKASGAARRARKTLREQLLAMLSEGNTQDNLCLALLERAKTGDTKAFEVIRDTVGEKPVEKVQNDMVLTQALVVFEKAKEDADGNSEDSGQVQTPAN